MTDLKYANVTTLTTNDARPSKPVSVGCFPCTTSHTGWLALTLHLVTCFVLQVMSKGQVKEFDSPYTLLQNPRSQFGKMVEQTGPSASKKLHQMAAEAHLRRLTADQQIACTDTTCKPSSAEIMLVTPL